MRYIAYGLAIFAAVFVIAFTTGYLPRDATASHNENPTTPPFARCERSALAPLPAAVVDRGAGDFRSLCDVGHSAPLIRPS